MRRIRKKDHIMDAIFPQDLQRPGADHLILPGLDRYHRNSNFPHPSFGFVSLPEQLHDPRHPADIFPQLSCGPDPAGPDIGSFHRIVHVQLSEAHFA